MFAMKVAGRATKSPGRSTRWPAYGQTDGDADQKSNYRCYCADIKHLYSPSPGPGSPGEFSELVRIIGYVPQVMNDYEHHHRTHGIEKPAHIEPPYQRGVLRIFESPFNQLPRRGGHSKDHGDGDCVLDYLKYMIFGRAVPAEEFGRHVPAMWVFWEAP